jgi:hypothetical protein
MRAVMAEKLLKLGAIEEVPRLRGVVGATPRSDFAKCHRVLEHGDPIEVYRYRLV